MSDLSWFNDVMFLGSKLVLFYNPIIITGNINVGIYSIHPKTQSVSFSANY